jgi:hypothetical protein
MADLSDTPSGAIARLDAALAQHGEDIILRRTVRRSGVDVVVDVACRAFVRAVSAQEIVGSIKATDVNVVISPTEILAAGWPGQDDVTPAGLNADQHHPRITDTAIVQGKPRQVRLSKPILMGGTWVRCDMVAGG